MNVADCPEEGDFTLPALLRRGELTVGVGTGGLSPLLAMAIRDRLKEQIGAEWETVLALAAALRQKGLTLPEPGEYNRKVWRLLSGDRLAAAAAVGDAAVIDELLETHLGEGFSPVDAWFPQREKILGPFFEGAQHRRTILRPPRGIEGSEAGVTRPTQQGPRGACRQCPRQEFPAGHIPPVRIRMLALAALKHALLHDLSPVSCAALGSV